MNYKYVYMSKIEIYIVVYRTYNYMLQRGGGRFKTCVASPSCGFNLPEEVQNGGGWHQNTHHINRNLILHLKTLIHIFLKI